MPTQIQKQIEEATNQICELIASVRTNGVYPAESFVTEIISNLATKSAEEGEKIAWNKFVDFMLLDGVLVYDGFGNILKIDEKKLILKKKE